MKLRCFVIVVLLHLHGSIAWACAICAPPDAQDTLVYRLFAADAAMLATADSGGAGFRPLEAIKGTLPGGSVSVAQWLPGASAAPAGASVLLLYSAAAHSWRGVGAVGRGHAHWLRRLVALKPVSLTGAVDWPARLAAFVPHLEDPEPLVAQAAYEEVAVAPYSVLRGLRPQLDARRIVRWLQDPQIAPRRPLYTLLWGFAAPAADAPMLEQRLALAAGPADVAALSAILAAYLELRGPAGVDLIERDYLTRTARSEAEIQAAVLALGVHGNDGLRVGRERIVAAYAVLVARNPPFAGTVASDLANWGRWEFGGRYADILRSGQQLGFASRYAMVFYLLRSPLPQARAAVQELRSSGLL